MLDRRVTSLVVDREWATIRRLREVRARNVLQAEANGQTEARLAGEIRSERRHAYRTQLLQSPVWNAFAAKSLAEEILVPV